MFTITSTQQTLPLSPDDSMIVECIAQTMPPAYFASHPLTENKYSWPNARRDVRHPLWSMLDTAAVDHKESPGLIQWMSVTAYPTQGYPRLPDQ
jgi:hypothetical protein